MCLCSCTTNIPSSSYWLVYVMVHVVSALPTNTTEEANGIGTLLFLLVWWYAVSSTTCTTNTQGLSYHPPTVCGVRVHAPPATMHNQLARGQEDTTSIHRHELQQQRIHRLLVVCAYSNHREGMSHLLHGWYCSCILHYLLTYSTAWRRACYTFLLPMYGWSCTT
jgi:hypothetical protein